MPFATCFTENMIIFRNLAVLSEKNVIFYCILKLELLTCLHDVRLVYICM